MIPCKDCLVLPVCRLKQYSVMLRECDPLLNLLYKGTTSSPTLRDHKVFNKEIFNLEKILKPTMWRTTRDKAGYVHLMGKRQRDSM